MNAAAGAFVHAADLGVLLAAAAAAAGGLVALRFLPGRVPASMPASGKVPDLAA